MTTPTAPSIEPAPPHEPEIAALGRVARRALWVLRRVLWCAGVAALAFCAWRLAAPPPLDDSLQELGQNARAPRATFVVWACLGLPLVAPVDWLLGRGRWVALAIAVVLWLGPSLSPGDHPYGFVLRMFGTLVAVLTLLVWRTLWSLARPAPPAA